MRLTFNWSSTELCPFCDVVLAPSSLSGVTSTFRSEVLEVAKNTLEGHLRAVVASLTPEEVNEDRLKFSERLSHEAETDLNKLGLHLDTFNIHSVGDIQGSSYLAEIGRKSIAEVLKTAEVFEADCERAATEAEADAKSRSDVAREQAEQEIRTKKNNLDEEKAKLEAAAKSAEEEAEAARETARARAELELQQVRSELEAKRLQAEVVVKANRHEHPVLVAQRACHTRGRRSLCEGEGCSGSGQVARRTTVRRSAAPVNTQV